MQLETTFSLASPAESKGYAETSRHYPDATGHYPGAHGYYPDKRRSLLPKDIEKELLSADRKTLFKLYGEDHAMQVYLLIGIGGLPSEPDNLYLAILSETISIDSLLRNNINTVDDILKQILPPQQKTIADFDFQ